MAQLVTSPTLGFGSGHDLTIHEFKHHIGLCSDSVELPWDFLSPSLSAPTSLSLSPSFKINKLKTKNKLQLGCLGGSVG